MNLNQCECISFRRSEPYPEMSFLKGGGLRHAREGAEGGAKLLLASKEVGATKVHTRAARDPPHTRKADARVHAWAL